MSKGDKVVLVQGVRPLTLYGLCNPAILAYLNFSGLGHSAPDVCFHEDLRVPRHAVQVQLQDRLRWAR